MPVGEGRAKLAACVMMIVAGIAFFLVGTIMLGAYGSKSRCTEPVSATVVKNLEIKKVSNGSVRDIRRVTYVPVFEYEYKGVKYSYISKISSRPPEYSEGEQVAIRVNPNDPEDICYKPKGGALLMSIMFRIIGVVLAVVGAVRTIAARVRKGKATLDHQDRQTP